jgi:hypothetical protein
MAAMASEEQPHPAEDVTDAEDDQRGRMLEKGHTAREAGAYEASRGRFQAAAAHHAHAAECFDAAVAQGSSDGGEGGGGGGGE